MSSFDIREDFDHAAFARQADRYPALAALAGREFSEASSALKLDAITAYLPKRLERNDGLPSSALDLDEEAVALFAGLPPRGWPSLRSRLGRTDRAGYSAALSELRLALAFTRWAGISRLSSRPFPLADAPTWICCSPASSSPSRSSPREMKELCGCSVTRKLWLRCSSVSTRASA